MFSPGSLVLVRHGQTEWSASGQHTGLTDLPLTAQGEADARRVGTRLEEADFDLVLTSTLTRAWRTAELMGFPAAERLTDLVEWDYGAFEGLTTAEIQKRRGEAWTVFSGGVEPGDTPGETVEEVLARASRVLMRIRPVLQEGGRVLVVAHGHTLRILASAYVEQAPRFGSNLALDAGALCVLSTHHGAPIIERWNVPAQEIAPTIGA